MGTQDQLAKSYITAQVADKDGEYIDIVYLALYIVHLSVLLHSLHSILSNSLCRVRNLVL
jgi:hypothetical protein